MQRDGNRLGVEIRANSKTRAKMKQQNEEESALTALRKHHSDTPCAEVRFEFYTFLHQLPCTPRRQPTTEHTETDIAGHTLTVKHESQIQPSAACSSITTLSLAISRKADQKNVFCIKIQSLHLNDTHQMDVTSINFSRSNVFKGSGGERRGG